VNGEREEKKENKEIDRMMEGRKITNERWITGEGKRSVFAHV
jgi:hypothetical protein